MATRPALRLDPVSSATARDSTGYLDLALILLLALAVRGALLPWAAQDSLDDSLRVWIGQRWAEDPFPLTWGVWGPLHFMLVGTIVRLTGDTLLAPRLLHLALNALIPLLVYLYTRRLFHSRQGAVLAGIATALYPAVIAVGMSVRSETPFLLLVMLCLVLLVRAREEASVGWAAAGGLALTLAAGFRYEAWMLIPLLGVVLLTTSWRAAVAFGVVALLWPVLSMASNAYVYGDPLWGITSASKGELVGMGRGDYTVLQSLREVAFFALRLAGAMTPLLAALVALGIVVGVRRRAPQLIWLVPPAGLTALLFLSTLRGTLVPKTQYTASIGVMLVPFAALLFTAGGPLARVGRTARLAVVGAVAVVMVALLAIGTARDVDGLRARYAFLKMVPAMSPTPVMAGRATLDGLIEAGRTRLPPDGGVIVDNLGYAQTGYAGLRTGAHPDRVFWTALRPNDTPSDRETFLEKPLRQRQFPLLGPAATGLADFLRRNPQGIMLLQPGSRFEGFLGVADDHADYAGLRIGLEPIARAPWPIPADPRFLKPGTVPGSAGELVIYAYHVERPLP